MSTRSLTRPSVILGLSLFVEAIDCGRASSAPWRLPLNTKDIASRDSRRPRAHRRYQKVLAVSRQCLAPRLERLRKSHA